MTTEFIYFDLGNVILNFCHQKGCQQVALVCNISPEEAHRGMFETGLEVKLETGLISSSQFATQFFDTVQARCSEAELFLAMSDIFTANQPVMHLLTRLTRQPIPIGVLSNTCQPHWNQVIEQFPELPQMFGTKILSYQVQSMKPDRPIYEAAISASGVSPEAIFFVDDRPDNVQGAIVAGIDAVRFTTPEQLEADLVSRGIATAS